MADLIKEAKDLGWDHITLSKSGFRGAIQEYQNNRGEKIALMFNFHEAFVIEDDQGLFGLRDYVEGVVKDKSLDIEATGFIEGLHVVAWENEGEIKFDEEKLEELGLNDFEVKDSLKRRLSTLAKLDVLIEMKLG